MVKVSGFGSGTGDVSYGGTVFCTVTVGFTTGACQYNNVDNSGDGDDITITAIPTGAHVFAGWLCSVRGAGNCQSCQIGPNCTLTYLPGTGDVTFDVTARFEVTPVTAAYILKESGDGLSGSGGSPITLAVKVFDSSDIPFPGARVDWSGGTVSPANSLSGSNGVASTVWTRPSTPGLYHVTATLAGTSSTYAFSGTVVACNNGGTSDDFSSDVSGRWTSIPVLPGPMSSAPTAYMTTGGSGGGTAPNPGGYWWLQHAEFEQGTTTVYHRLDLFEYDPSIPGNVIDHINYSEDQIVINPPFTGASVGWGFFFEQNGVRFTRAGAGFANLSWLTATIANLTAAAFTGTGTPNWGATGGKIKFGFFRTNFHTSGGATTLVTHGIDNFRLEICKK